jgi:hypothetical protein
METAYGNPATARKLRRLKGLFVTDYSIYTVCPRSVRTVFIKNTRRELFSKFHTSYSK